MSLLVTGSIATDHLMSFPGKFADSLVVDQLDKIALSFLVEDLEVRRGGCAANIACFSLYRLVVVVLGVHSGKFSAEEDPARIREILDGYGLQLLGGFVPALRAARIPIATVMRA